MIFITVGSQKFQFNRVLKKVDLLIEKQLLKSDEIFAQTGHSTYKPIHYEYQNFLNKDDFLSWIDRSTIVITHGGTGSIINAVKKEKKVIGIPRSVEYGEHVDNHQFEIIDQFSDLNLIYKLVDTTHLEKAILEVQNMEFRKYQSNTQKIISILDDYLDNIK